MHDLTPSLFVDYNNKNKKKKTYITPKSLVAMLKGVQTQKG